MENLFLGIFLTVAGVLVIVFHKQLRERTEAWNERVPWFLRSSPRGGLVLTIAHISIGVILIYIGIRILLTQMI